MKNYLLTFCLLLLASVWVLAQTSVSGRVVGAEDGEPLPGVAIKVVGTDAGTVTDFDGNYKINVPSGGSQLEFSYLGFLSQTVDIGNRSTIDIQLEPDVETLEEIVVIGYGERQRKDLTGAISEVGAEEIEKGVAVSPEMRMQGRMAGVLVQTPSGDPSERPIVRIRGTNTFYNNDPLFVIDGVPVTEWGQGSTDAREGDLRGPINILAMINPADIESMTVLKDASAAAIYGVRASNGVVLITTKRGKEGRPRVDFTAKVGFQNTLATNDLLNTPQYLTLYDEAFNNNPASERPGAFIPDSVNSVLIDQMYLGDIDQTYDWQTPLLNKNANIQDYSARVYGGTESVNYNFSTGYSRTEGPFINNYLERYSISANMDAKIGKHIRTGFSFRSVYSNTRQNEPGDLEGMVISAPPLQPIFVEDTAGLPARINNRFIYSDTATALGFVQTNYITNQATCCTDPDPSEWSPDFALLWGPETEGNGYGQEAQDLRRYEIFRNLASGYIDIRPLEGLSIKTVLSVDWFLNTRKQFRAESAYMFGITPGNPFNQGNRYGERLNQNWNLNLDFLINYNRSFGDHNFDLLLGQTNQEWGNRVSTISGQNLLVADYPNVNDASPEDTNGFTTQRDRSLQGYMARLSYNFAGKYYLDGTYRRDGTSRFAPENRWGNFLSFAAAWRISSEDFMNNVTWLDDLKLRGGWGQIGNQEIGTDDFFPHISTVSNSPTYAFGSGVGDPRGLFNFGISLPKFVNPELSWETNETTNIGFDAVFLNNTFNLTVEYYNKTNRDILLGVNLAPSVGLQDNVLLNAATVRNSGFEFVLGYTKQFGDFTFNVNGNFTTVDNEVTETFENLRYFTPAGIAEPGRPIGYIRGYKVGGLFQTQQDVDDYQANTEDIIATRQEPGDLFFQDIGSAPAELGDLENNVPDSVVNGFDQTFLGSTIPGHFYGLNISLGWKGLDLSIFFQGVGDWQQINSIRRKGEGMSSLGINQWASTENRWTGPGTSTDFPRAVQGDPASNNRTSDRWVEDAGFVRLKNIQLGYNLPQSLLEKTNVFENLRIYVSGINTFTITNWSGLDPENDANPPTRAWNLGINATF